MINDFERIEKAIHFLKENFRQQPELDEVAKQVYLSPFHFQRLFKEWAGVSPKKFLQYISVAHAKKLLQQSHSISDVSFETGFSGSSRLHDLFIQIEGMTPGEYKNQGENLEINYNFGETAFGEILIGSTSKGICFLAFVKNRKEGMAELKKMFSRAKLLEKRDEAQENAMKIFKDDWNNLDRIKLHLKGTAFQLKVWEALLKIPFASVSTYASIAGEIKNPEAFRAVGTAIGKNPVAFLIPCHRVIKSTGVVGDYHWGSSRKTAILGWEASKCFGEN